MKKSWKLFLVSAMCLFLLIGCGSKSEEIKEELRGTWSYDFYASAVDQHCHQIYEFSPDSVEVSWINDEVPEKNTFHTGTYKIDENKKKISITFDDGSKSNIIEYSYNNGKLKLFDKGTDGSVEEELIRK